MKQEQENLCVRHYELLHFIWVWGWGCALQPLLVDVAMYFDWYASRQMCRRYLRDLKQAGLLKAKTWVDGKSEILILKKPAIAFVSDKDSKAVSSYPKHSTRESELLSICRMMYMLQWAKNREEHRYDRVVVFFYASISTIHRRIGELQHYWLHTPFFRDKKFSNDFILQAICLQESREERLQLHIDKDERIPVEKHTHPVGTMETLHRRGISIVGKKQEGEITQLLFGVFNIHNLTARKVMEHYVLCNRWVKSLHDDLEARLIVYCMDHVQQKELEKNLLRTSHGRPFWEQALASKADISKGIPVAVRNIGLKHKYMAGKL